MNNKNIFTIFVIFAIFGLILPSSLAQDTTTTIAGRSADVCVAGPSAHSRIDRSIANADAKRDAKKADVSDDVRMSRDKVRNKIEELRGRWDAERQNDVARLRANAKSESQRAAVETFADKVDVARDERDAAVQAATDQFRADLDAIIADKRAFIDSTIQTFKDAVDAAYDKAQADCQAGLDKATISANLRADLDAAREQFRTDRQQLGLKYSIKGIVEARKDAVRDAKEEFQTAVRAAGDELKASWSSA